MNENTRGNEAQPTHEQISELAYAKYVERGAHGHGFDLQDWFDAEAELRAPISTASQEAAVRGAEAEAAEEKRVAEMDGPLPPEARALMTNDGAAFPSSDGPAKAGATTAKPRASRKTAAKPKTTADVANGGNAVPDPGAPLADAGETLPRKPGPSRRKAVESKNDLA